MSEIKNELLDTLRDSIPVWSYFIGGVICSTIGIFSFVLPDILMMYKTDIGFTKGLALHAFGLFWMISGINISIIYPIRHIYRILRSSECLVKKAECEFCNSIIGKQAEEIRTLKNKIENIPSEKDTGPHNGDNNKSG